MKKIKIIKPGQENIGDILNREGNANNIFFIELQKDTIGKSGARPTWGKVLNLDDKGHLRNQGIALHKEYDYDFPHAAYAEKSWSIIGKKIFGDRIRIPTIDIVEQVPREPETISYRLMDNDTEDMIHIKDLMYNKFERKELKAKKDIYPLEEVLECIRLQVNDEQNYKEIEESVIQVLLLDAITNNGDRHALNWALVRDEETNKYTLAVFDHASSFVDMFEDKSYILGNGWSTSFVTVGKDERRTDIGSDGKVLVEYISKKYPEYFEEYCELFESSIAQSLEDIKRENMKIDFKRLSKKMYDKLSFLKKIKSKGEMEYE